MQINLINELKKIIPSSYTTFDELKENIKSYYFEKWDTDINNEACLYYWFYSKDKKNKNKKRIVISELIKLLKFCKNENIKIVDRTLFSRICVISYNNGPCSYCVSIRMLAYLNLAQYLGSNGFEIFIDNYDI